MSGDNKEIYGLLLRDEFHARSFTSAAQQVYGETGAILFAAQDAQDGQVHMNPGSSCIIGEHTVVFCIAPSAQATQSIRRENHGEWLRTYESNRSDRQHRCDQAPKKTILKSSLYIVCYNSSYTGALTLENFCPGPPLRRRCALAPRPPSPGYTRQRSSFGFLFKGEAGLWS